MSIKSYIGDGENRHKRSAGVDYIERYGAGLKVFSYDGNPMEFGSAFFANLSYGNDMNQNVTFGGTPDQVHNGEDASLWTASTPVGSAGSFIENSTTVFHSGTRSVDATPSTDGETIQFAKGSNLTIANYTALTGWIYITSWPTTGTKDVRVVCWDTGSALAVSDTIDLSSYIDIGLAGAWQKFAIPFSTFNFTSSTLDAVRFITIDSGAGSPPDYYLDDIQFEETGSPAIFSVGPPPGEIWHVNGIFYTMADAYAGTVTNGTMPGIPYDGILGMSSLTVGAVLRRIQFDQTQFSVTLRNIMDWLSTAAPKNVMSGSDGTNTWVRLEASYPAPIIFDGDKGDRYELVINDDMSALLHFRGGIHFAKEIRER